MKIIFTAKGAKGRKGKATRRIFSGYRLVLISFANLRVLCGKAFDWQSE
ncbi:MAG: hypothetical protein K8H75_09790 [Sulfuricella sp.]|nr:hypothetical protein [Sulfuricella sp.]